MVAARCIYEPALYPGSYPGSRFYLRKREKWTRV